MEVDFFLTLSEESVERGKKPDRLVDFRRGAGPIGAEADQLLHVGVGGEDLPRPPHRRANRQDPPTAASCATRI